MNSGAYFGGLRLSNVTLLSNEIDDTQNRRILYIHTNNGSSDSILVFLFGGDYFSSLIWLYNLLSVDLL